jgi:hypothetical protein
MNHDPIDRILGEDPPLRPTSGFADSVMDAVRREAEGPEPLSFPWRRVAPGMAVCLVAIVAAVIAALSGPSGTESQWTPLANRLESTLLAQSTLWLAGTLMGSWLVVRVSLIFSGFER